MMLYVAIDQHAKQITVAIRNVHARDTPSCVVKRWLVLNEGAPWSKPRLSS